MADDDRQYAVNYWENVNLKLEDNLSQIKSNLLFIHNSFEFIGIVDFLNRLSSGNQILYVSLTKTYNSIKPHFNKINMEVFCVDCISMNLFDVENKEDCIFTPTPSNIRDFSKLMTSMPKNINPDYIVIDSISHLMGYQLEDRENNLTFMSDVLKEMTSFSSSKLIFLYDESVSGELVFLPSVSFEKIIKANSLKDKVYWRD